MNCYYAPFPFKEKTFENVSEAIEAGYQHNQVWSVCTSLCGEFIVYGSATHNAGLLRYVATDESHDQRTYFYARLLPNNG